MLLLVLVLVFLMLYFLLLLWLLVVLFVPALFSLMMLRAVVGGVGVNIAFALVALAVVGVGDVVIKLLRADGFLFFVPVLFSFAIVWGVQMSKGLTAVAIGGQAGVGRQAHVTAGARGQMPRATA